MSHRHHQRRRWQVILDKFSQDGNTSFNVGREDENYGLNASQNSMRSARNWWLLMRRQSLASFCLCASYWRGQGPVARGKVHRAERQQSTPTCILIIELFLDTVKHVVVESSFSSSNALHFSIYNEPAPKKKVEINSLRNCFPRWFHWMRFHELKGIFIKRSERKNDYRVNQMTDTKKKCFNVVLLRRSKFLVLLKQILSASFSPTLPRPRVEVTT